MSKHIFLLLSLALPVPAYAALHVFACEPEWAALTRQLAGNHATLFTATHALQDPHHIEARPSLIARARRADLVVCTGAELEIAWLPILISESGNPAIAPGKPGYFEAAYHVPLLDVPLKIDRSHGDVHVQGNPHIHTDARNFLPIAEALTQRLIALDPANKADYLQNHADFSRRWRAAIMGWEQRAAPLEGVPVAVQHNAFPYLLQWLGLKEIVHLEPKPGLEPSVAHLSQVLSELQHNPAKMVLYATYQNPRPSNWLSAKADIPAVPLPYTVSETASTDDLFKLFDVTITRLLNALVPNPQP